MNLRFICNVPNGISSGSILFLAFENEVKNATGQKAKNSNLKADPVILMRTDSDANMKEVNCVMKIEFTCEVDKEVTNLDLLRIVLEEGIVNVTGQKPSNGILETDNEVYKQEERK
jgi:hypothetical protein